MKNLRIALVFDWLTVPGGAERVNLELHHIFPEADIFTSIYNPQKVKGFAGAKIATSFIQKLPFAKKHHQLYIGLMPYAYELFDLSQYDLVISSSHAAAKGVITKPETVHISYCHSPMRYAWDNWQTYIKEYKMNWFFKWLGKRMMHRLRIWDRLSADRVDHFIANSSIVQARIKKYYNRESTIIHPMIDLAKFPLQTTKDRYFLAVGRLTASKKMDLIIETFNKNGLPLKIVGTGVSAAELRRKADKNIEFLGFIPDEQLAELYANARALVFPQEEDFGIVPLEAMACGTPIIALEKGGALDTIIDGKTGIFFAEQTPESLEKALQKFEKATFNPAKIREHAAQFDKEKFKEKLLKKIAEVTKTQKTLKKDEMQGKE